MGGGGGKGMDGGGRGWVRGSQGRVRGRVGEGRVGQGEGGPGGGWVRGGEGASAQTGQSLPVLQPQSQASLTPQGGDNHVSTCRCSFVATEYPLPL